MDSTTTTSNTEFQSAETTQNVLRITREMSRKQPAYETLVQEWTQRGRSWSELHDLADDLESLAIWLRIGVHCGSIQKPPSFKHLAQLTALANRIREGQ